MRGVISDLAGHLAVASRTLPAPGARLRCGLLLGLLELALYEGWPRPAAAQNIPIQTTVIPGTRSTGVPESKVSCAGYLRDDYPSISCTVYFETPVDVIRRPSVVDSDNKSQEWTAPLFRAFDPTEYDTAFYVLIDRRTFQKIQMSHLSDVFAPAKGRQQVAVSTFATDLTPVLPFTTDRNAIKEFFGSNRIRAGGSGSELLRFAQEAIRQFQNVSALRKVLLISSFGKSDDKAYGIDSVIKLAREAGVHVVSLGYVDQPADAPNLQLLERMSSETGGYYYKFDTRRQEQLPQEVRSTILTRYSAGGKFEATAPSKGVPRSVDVALQHPNNLTSGFGIGFAAAAMPPEKEKAGGVTASPESWLDGMLKKLRTWNPWYLIAAALAVLLVVVALIQSLRSRRGTDDTQPMPPTPVPLASAEQIGENLDGLNAAQPGAAQKPAGEPGGNVLFPVADAPVIAWLEFNSSPGRVAVRKRHVTIGREVDNDVVTSSSEDTVSRHHAVLSVNNNGRFQISNRSTEYRHTPNPIFINDKELERAELSDGDRVKLGTGSYGFVFVEIR